MPATASNHRHLPSRRPSNSPPSHVDLPRSKVQHSKRSARPRPLRCRQTPTHLPHMIRHAANTSSNRFPFNNFKYFLTLFSKFFSSFPHGTCSLSVYEIYHPFRAAFPNNPTPRERIVQQHTRQPATDGIFTLHDVSFQATCTGRATGKRFSRLQFKLLRSPISNLSSSHFTRRY